MSTTTTEALRLQTTRPPAGPARGSFIVIPGRGNTDDAYDRLATRLTFDGYTVTVLPTATGPASVRASIAGVLGDLPTPVVIIAADVSAALIAIAFGDEPIAGVAGVVLAGASASGSESTASTLDEEIAQRTACPVHSRVLSTGLEALSFGPDTDRWSALWATSEPLVSIPALVVHGAADQLADVDVVAKTTSSWPARTFAVVGGGVHDVLNDVHHRSVAAAIVQFAEAVRLDPSGSPILTIGSSH